MTRVSDNAAQPVKGQDVLLSLGPLQGYGEDGPGHSKRGGCSEVVAGYPRSIPTTSSLLRHENSDISRAEGKCVQKDCIGKLLSSMEIRIV